MKLELICLGVGQGASYVLRGVPSTAFVLLINGRPYLLIDCGAGVARSYQQQLNLPLPTYIYISHNHLDHTGDLPIVAVHLKNTTGKPKIFGHPEVLDIVKKHRFHELSVNGLTPSDYAEWQPAGTNGILTLDPYLSLHLVPCQHSYICFGFVLFYRGEPILSYSADSGFQEDIYNQLLIAPKIIVDGRKAGNTEHAGFEEIQRFFVHYPQKWVGVVHYEQSDHVFSSPHIRFLQIGERFSL